MRRSGCYQAAGPAPGRTDVASRKGLFESGGSGQGTEWRRAAPGCDNTNPILRRGCRITAVRASRTARMHGSNGTRLAG